MSGKGDLTPWQIVSKHPAFPCVIEQHNQITGDSNIMQFAGLSQRQTIAMYVLAAQIGAEGIGGDASFKQANVGNAFAYADAFLKFEFDEAMAKRPPDAPDPNEPTKLIVVPK